MNTAPSPLRPNPFGWTRDPERCETFFVSFVCRPRNNPHQVFTTSEIRGVDDFKRAHDMTEDVIEKIQTLHPGADITVHFDPEGAR